MVNYQGGSFVEINGTNVLKATFGGFVSLGGSMRNAGLLASTTA